MTLRRTLLLLPVFLAAADFARAQLVAPGSTWKYLDDGSNQGSAWRSLAFDDSLWASGSAQLGYGDGDEATVVSYGPNSNSKYITTYFRQEFTVVNPGSVVALTANLVDDDGSVVYINGVEVVRNNMPGGTIGYLTQAVSAVGSSTENNIGSWNLSPGVLVAGTNIVAVEIHQASGTSSDISFDLELTDAIPPDLSRGPYLQMSGPDRMLLRWRTFLPEDSRVQFGAAPGSLTTVVDDPTVTTEHSVMLTGLASDTVYYYSVGDSSRILAGDDADHWFHTSPDVGGTRPSRFWILGDCGSADGNQRAVRDAFLSYNGGPSADLVLLLGDNAYQNGEDGEYQAAVFDMYQETLRTSPMWSTRGNHENNTSDYYAMYDFPTAGELGGLASGSEAYYSFDFGNVHLICLDSDATSLSPTGAMATWVTADLAATAQPWIVVFFHHPPYTKGSHDSDNVGDSSGRMIDMRENFLPILEDGGVDLVFSGHSHAYERSFLIDGHYGMSYTFSAAHQADSGDGSTTGDGAYVKGFGPHEGAVYTVAGSSGKTSSSGSLNHPAMQNSHRVLGSVVLDVNDDRLDVEFLTSTGQVLDEYTLTTADQPPMLASSPLVAGQFGFLTVSNATPGATILVGYSLSGPGSTSSPYGDILLDAPFGQFPSGTANALGLFSIVDVVPLSLSGATIWLQALEITGPGTGLLSNGLAEAVQ
jgi:hypothetical protein